MEMVLGGRMGARRFVLAVTVALAALCSGAVCAPSQDAAKPPVQTPIDQSTSQDSPSSSSNPVHEKTGPDSSRTIHHIRVAEKDDNLPEKKKAKILTQKHDMGAAEPKLQGLVAGEPANFEAWYVLGFVENS